MKTLSSLFALSLVALLPTGVLAQTSAPGGTTARQSKPDRQTWSNTQGLHETGDIIGTNVQDSQGKTIGKVDALLIDPKDGKVSQAVIGLGGVLGVGAEKVVVNWSDLKMSGHENGRKAMITLDRSTLEGAPKYVKARDRQPSASPTTYPSGPKTDTTK